MKNRILSRGRVLNFNQNLVLVQTSEAFVALCIKLEQRTLLGVENRLGVEYREMISVRTCASPA